MKHVTTFATRPIFYAFLMSLVAGCATTSEKTLPNALPINQETVSKHTMLDALIVPSYSYDAFDFVVFDTDFNSFDVLSPTYAANELVKFLKARDHLEGRATVVLASSNWQVDNSPAYRFDVTLGSKHDSYYVTTWGKVLNNNTVVLGRISKQNAEPGEVPKPAEYDSKVFDDFVYVYPKSSPALPGLDSEAAANYIAHRMIPELGLSSDCRGWSVSLDGISEIDGQKAYEFSVYHAWFAPKDEDDVFSADDKNGTPVRFRVAITEGRKIYLFERVAERAGQITDKPVAEPLPPDPKLAKKYKQSLEKAKDNLIDAILLVQFEEKLQYTAYPEYRLKLDVEVSEKALPWIRNVAENLNAWAKKYPGEATKIIQTVIADDQPIALAVASSSMEVNHAFERLIVYRGKHTVDGHTRHRFSIGQVNVDQLKSLIAVEIDVDEDNTFYLLTPSITPYGTLAQTLPPIHKAQLDDELMRDYASARDAKGVTSSMCAGTYKAINLGENFSDKAPDSSSAAEYIMSHLDQFYQGERNLNPWYITEQPNEEIQGVKAHIFSVGQGINAHYPIYFRAAVDENHKVYRYDGTPVYVATMPTNTATKSEEEKRLKEIQSNLNRMFSGVAPAATSEKKDEKPNKETDAVYPAQPQDAEKLWSIYKMESFVEPNMERPEDEEEEEGNSFDEEEKEDPTILYAEFDYEPLVDYLDTIQDLTAETAAIYINASILPSLKRFQPFPWRIRFAGMAHLEALDEDALIFHAGYTDYGDFKKRAFFAVTGDRKVYHPHTVYTYVQDMATQKAPEMDPKDYVGFSFGKTSTVSYRYPLFYLTIPAPLPEFDSIYPIAQAATEIEAAYLHEHNDGKWSIAYEGITEIEGARAWKFRITYGEDAFSFYAAATETHKLYRATDKLESIGIVPPVVATPEKDKASDSVRWYSDKGRYCGIGLLNEGQIKVTSKDEISPCLAASGVFDTLSTTYTGTYNSTPWRAVGTGVTTINNVNAYTFDVGQGKYQMDKVLFRAAVAQDRKIYKITEDAPEFVGMIGENDPEP